MRSNAFALASAGMVVVVALDVVVITRVVERLAVDRGAVVVVRDGAVVDLVVVRCVVRVASAVRVAVMVVVASPEVHSGHVVVLSSSVVDSATVVVSSVVVSSESGSGGGLKICTKMTESRITARKMPIKMAVRLSFLSFRWPSPSFLIISQDDRYS